MAKNKKWSSAAKFEIALQAIKNDAPLNEICKNTKFHLVRYMHGKSSCWKKVFSFLTRLTRHPN